MSVVSGNKRRIGVMTGGGDCPGLNAFVRAVVKRAILDFDLEVIGIHEAYRGLCEPGLAAPLTLEDVRGILPLGGTILGTSNRHDPFRYPVVGNGTVVERDRSAAALARAAELELEGIVAAGGDGTMIVANKLSRLGLDLVGCPKTIDNDLAGTDMTFGFDTARAICTDAIDKLHSTAQAHRRVMVLEVMGRNAGFLALESGIAGGADVILVPEIPYRLEPIVETVSRRGRRGRSFSIVVVAEGAHPEGGSLAVAENAAETPGRGVVRLGGAGDVLARALGAAIEAEIRVTVLGHLQRGGSPTAADRLLATRVGVMGAELAAEGRWGHLVAVRGQELAAVPLAEAASARVLDRDGELVRAARKLEICLGDEVPSRVAAAPAAARG